MQIFLIRHGQSQAQLNESILRDIDDAEVDLSSLGHAQADKSAEVMEQVLEEHPGTTELYISPYARSRQTAKYFIDRLRRADDGGKLHRIAENSALIERRKGVIAGLNSQDFQERYPELFAEFEDAWRKNEFHGVFIPSGENYLQVEIRLDLFATMIADACARGVRNFIVIGHNVANRLLAKKLLDKNYDEFYATEPSAANCSIRKLDMCEKKCVDCGYIYTGDVAL